MVRPVWTKLACGQALVGASGHEAGASAQRGWAGANVARVMERGG